METTNRVTAREIAAVRRTDVAIGGEGQDVREDIVRRSRPIVAVAADTEQIPIAVAAITRSWVPDDGSTSELAGEVYAFVGDVI